MSNSTQCSLRLCSRAKLQLISVAAVRGARGRAKLIILVVDKSVSHFSCGNNHLFVYPEGSISFQAAYYFRCGGKTTHSP